MRKIILTLILILIITGCAPAIPMTEEPTPLATPTSAPAPTDIPVGDTTVPPDQIAVQSARISLANMLAIRFGDIEVASAEAVEWSDGCLGAGLPDEMCTQVITPGYRILLNVGPVQYEYHTNANGTIVKLVGQPALLSESTVPVLVWRGANCDVYSVSLTQASYRKCSETNLITATNIQPANLAIVSAWANKFKSFEAETPAGKVTFTGSGDFVATISEQRMMAEWASLGYDVASSGRAGAAWGLAFTWHREGGIAGFCDDVSVYLTGLYMASSCQTNQPALPMSGYLTASQLDQLYGWVDSLISIDYSYTDPAVADAMTIKLLVTGKGKNPAADDTIRSIGEFAADIDAQAMFTANAPADLFAIQNTLSDFFAALHEGDYIKGAKLYGGPIDTLRDNNLDVNPNDLPALLERACTQNGWQCLQPRSVTYHGPDARGGYQFNIEFNNPDGTRFVQGPCCGDTSGTGVSNFVIAIVKQENGLWLVMDLPPYVP